MAPAAYVSPIDPIVGGISGVPDLFSANFPPEAFGLSAGMQHVIASTMPLHILEPASDALIPSTLMLGVAANEGVVMILTSSRQAVTSIPVEVTVPATGSGYAVLYYNIWDDLDVERLEYWEATDVLDASVPRKVHVLVPEWAWGSSGSGLPGSVQVWLLVVQLDASAASMTELKSMNSSFSITAGCGGDLAPVLDGNPRITSPFGSRTDPVTKEPGKFHGGIDYDVPSGTPVKAAIDGKVYVLRQENKTTGALKGYGYYVMIVGEKGTTLYGHLTENSAQVVNGKRVKAGDFIAKSGNTGKGTGAHLHFEYAPKSKQAAPTDQYKQARVDPKPCFNGPTKGPSIVI